MSNSLGVRENSPASVDAGPDGQLGITGPVRLFLFALVAVVIAESIGNVTVPLGFNKIVLLPLLWALLIGAAIGLAAPRLPGVLKVSASEQRLASAFLQPTLLIFIAKLGLLVGGSVPKIMSAGWSLVFQEFGHFFGTMVFGLPVALLLGIKREAIGATFSVGREPSLAIISERFGMDSPKGAACWRNTSPAPCSAPSSSPSSRASWPASTSSTRWRWPWAPAWAPAA